MATTATPLKNDFVMKHANSIPYKNKVLVTAEMILYFLTFYDFSKSEMTRKIR